MGSRYRVEFELVGNAGNIEAVLNRINNGISRVGTSSRRTTQEMGLWQRQMMAMGTTARYALAGGVVFGVTAAVGALSQFERGWGQVMALMSGIDTRRGFERAREDIGRLTSYSLRASNELATASDQVQNVITQAYSAFQIRQGRQGTDQVERFTDAVVKLGAVAESTDLDQLSKGVIGFSLAMGRGLVDVPRFASMLAQVSRISLFRGSELAQYIGQIGSGAITARMNPAEALAVLTAVSRGGGSQAVVARGVTQLLGRSLLFPQTPVEKQAFGQAGLPTDVGTLTRLGGTRVLLQMLNAVQRAGGVGISRAGRSMTDEQIATLGDQAAPADLGISGAGTAMARHFFGRIESFRAFTLMYSILTEDARQHRISLNQAFRNLVRQINNAGRSQKALDDQFKAFIANAQLSQASTAIHNAMMGLVRGADPLMHPIARGVTAASSALLAHPRITTALEGALFAGLGARVIGRFLPGGLGRIVGRVGRGVSGATGAAAGAALTAEAAANLLTGGVPTGARDNPIWVMIHPASWYVGSPGGDPTRNPAFSTAAQIGTGAGGLGAAVSAAARLARAARIARIAGTAGIVAGSGAIIASGVAHDYFSGYRDLPGRYELGRGVSFDPRSRDFYTHLGLRPGDLPTRTNQNIAASQIAQIAAALQAAPGGATITGFEGNLNGDFTIRLVDKQGREIAVQEHKGVPVKLWPKTPGVPQHRGKPKAVRKGH